ncbi:MAG: hypothetical protein AAF515_18285 [Pseudomonadota bacterium]
MPQAPRNRRLAGALIVTALLLAGCQPEPQRQTLEPGSAWPRLAPTSDGGAIVSYLLRLPTGASGLRFRTLRDGAWRDPVSIASNDGWLDNWADSPRVTPLDATRWVAAWFVFTDRSAFAYDIRLSQSLDGGRTWEQPFAPHHDGVTGEHGFISFAVGATVPLAAWLDGRGGHHAAAESGRGSAMQLRGRRLDRDLNAPAQLIDERVCDCCPTATAATPAGAIVVYRDRDDDEVRDIYYSRFSNADQRFSAPRPVARDGWRIGGCPVNGPAVAANGAEIAVAWFTGHPTPRVRAAFSSDGGERFAPALTLAGTEATPRDVIGRVGLAWQGADALVTLIADSTLWLYRLIPDKNGYRVGGEPRALVKLDPDRSTGMPSLLMIDGVAYIAWTDAQGAQIQRVAL